MTTRRIDNSADPNRAFSRTTNVAKAWPFLAFLIGAAAGVPLLLLLGHLMYLDKARVTDVSLSREADFRDYYLHPALVGGVAGGIIGCAVWVTQTRRRVARGLLVFSWSLLGLVAGFASGSAIMVALLASSGRSAGRMGISPLILLPVPALAIVGAITGYVIGVLKARSRERQES